jgi:hypothetical protein
MVEEAGWWVREASRGGREGTCGLVKKLGATCAAA